MTEKQGCTLCGADGHLAAQCNWNKEETAQAELHPDLKRVYDVIGLHYSHPVSILIANFENTKRFAELLHAVEREFFMVPGEPSDEPEDEGCEPDDVCLMSCWGSTQEQYLEQFRDALAVIQVRAALAQPSPADFTPEHTLFTAIRTSMPVNEEDEPTRYLITEEQLQRIRALEFGAQPSPAPELERPEVVAYLNEWRASNKGGIRVTPALSAMSEEGLQKEYGQQASVVRREPLMTVSQHDRIGMQWASLVHRAQARVAELEASCRRSDCDQRGNDAMLEAVTAELEALRAASGAADLSGVWRYGFKGTDFGMMDDGPYVLMEQVEKALSAPVAQAGKVPTVCDGKEQDAFEAWAAGEKMDMSCHPLHWLFLNEKTYSARQGWKAALEYVGSQITAAPAQGE
jgi:hypothetical protein